MKRPTSAVVGPYRYAIKFDKAAIDAAGLDEGEALRGLTRNSELLILVDPTIPPVLQRETLLHELLHAAYFASGGEINAAKDEHREETVVSLLSPRLFGVLCDNPAISAWILGLAE